MCESGADLLLGRGEGRRGFVYWGVRLNRKMYRGAQIVPHGAIILQNTIFLPKNHIIKELFNSFGKYAFSVVSCHVLS